MYISVLPMKSNGKLVFLLCRTFAEQQNKSPCSHSNDERALTGTFVTIDVSLAKNYGYKVLEIYEIWQFDEFSEYDSEKMTCGIFNDYINHGLCSKQMALGFSFNCHVMMIKKPMCKNTFKAKIFKWILIELKKIQASPSFVANFEYFVWLFCIKYKLSTI
jgi:hypothetical protein